MSFKNILRSLSLNVKKDDHQKPSQMLPVAAPAPEFTFIRSDTVSPTLALCSFHGLVLECSFLGVVREIESVW
jgi:hypothetical protein